MPSFKVNFNLNSLNIKHILLAVKYVTIQLLWAAWRPKNINNNHSYYHYSENISNGCVCVWEYEYNNDDDDDPDIMSD